MICSVYYFYMYEYIADGFCERKTGYSRNDPGRIPTCIYTLTSTTTTNTTATTTTTTTTTTRSRVVLSIWEAPKLFKTYILKNILMFHLPFSVTYSKTKEHD